jgi:hypothetical protein
MYGIERQAYHDIDLIDTTLPHRRRDQLRHLAIPEMHMRVESSRQLNLFTFEDIHLSQRYAVTVSRGQSIRSGMFFFR